MFRLFGKTAPNPIPQEPAADPATAAPVSAMSLLFGQNQAVTQARPSEPETDKAAITARVDVVRPPDTVSGWARARAAGATPVEIVVRLDDVEIGRALATQARDDLI